MNTSEHGPHTPSPNDEQPPVPNPGRDAHGRFLPGNLGGPGNPFARRVARLRQVMLECVTEKEMEIIVGELMVQAQRGKLAAIKLLFQYVLGKPAATVDPDTLDLQEIDLFRRSPTPEQATEVVSGRLPAGSVAEVLRFTMPCVGARFQEGIFAEPLPAAPPSPNGDDRCGDRAAPIPNGKTRPADQPRQHRASNDKRPPSANGSSDGRNRGPDPFPSPK